MKTAVPETGNTQDDEEQNITVKKWLIERYGFSEKEMNRFESRRLKLLKHFTFFLKFKQFFVTVACSKQ